MEERLSSYLQLLAENSEEGMIITDIQDSILYMNVSARMLLNSDDVRNRSLSALIPIENLKTQGEKQKVFKLGNKTLSIRVSAVHVEDLPLCLWYLSDITLKVRLERELTCLKTIFDYIDEGVIMSDPENRITLYNKPISNFEEMNPDQVLGKHLDEIYKLNQHSNVLSTGIPLKDSYKRYSTTTGKELQGMGKTYPVIKDNKVIAVFSVVRDVSVIRQLLFKAVELQEGAYPKKASYGTRYTFKDIIGENHVMTKAIRESQKIAQTYSPVLICGETGTGKELFAQSIHNYKNVDQPFVAINCAALPESLLESLLFGTIKGAFTGADNMKGLFEQAGEGTLFLDEINSMSIMLQAKLLRVLQEKLVRRIGATTEIPVNCHVISSCNEDPEECVNNGTLRKDLYYRLALIRIDIPALRERGKDIESLAEFFLTKFARLYGKKTINLSEDFRRFLYHHTWPGNVRELEYTLESCVAIMDDEEELSINSLPTHLRSKLDQDNYPTIAIANSGTLSCILRDVEKKVILTTLQEHHWNIARSAKAIGIGRQNLQYRMRKLEIENQAFSH
ncbi:transcriptional regulator containing PAS, AAA-type ATPase, and DNA-binding domains [Desulfosporosinus orientis DSM 765]|uniref:Transcriptional regulator containing PAS, AAA-type ATPase, and DNA-binding domains n=1 Tax=Desulfosporosinus orientis (strain ATCC 19365 / DSM 765 / NCIMB 8382 / VKM B-1628 / Singapore I) TaxID=768706 RepID=G7W6W4_DESOD|nr:sigma-54-dependent Fis family transcriptional regulator [Desulfosporosinus orientis]AET69821.1 transcriptional regulator containing PAS, AAA-type ATPase, and DNA-binding domains [Desulfosporosinus orientis DSM 765]